MSPDVPQVDFELSEAEMLQVRADYAAYCREKADRLQAVLWVGFVMAQYERQGLRYLLSIYR